MKLFRKAETPEPQGKNQRLHIDPWLCHACGACVGICPTNALFLSDMTLRVNDTLCSQCAMCVRTCPVAALSLQAEVAHA